MNQIDIDYINCKAEGKIIESISVDSDHNSITLKFLDKFILKIFIHSIGVYIKP
jgi:hypothetical protein